MQQTQSSQKTAPSYLATLHYSKSNRYLEAALYYFERGYKVIPIESQTKRTAVKWDPWLADLSKQKINQYWLQNPTHELGFIVGDDLIVFDADSPVSIAALVEIEKAFDITPNLIIKTTKGVHHYYKRAKGTVAKSDSHCTMLHPERIDVKTGRALIILPPSSGKSIVLNEAENADELTEIGQDFIDAIDRHNGRNTQKFTSKSSSNVCNLVNAEKNYFGLIALLNLIDPDQGYDDWLKVLAAIFNETKDSEYGLEIAIAWSSKGKKYKGEKEIEAKWHSFSLNHPRPAGLGTLIKMVENGHAIFIAAEEPFEIISAGGAL